MRTIALKFITSLLVVFYLSGISTSALAADNQIVRFKGKVKYLANLDTYVLRSDDNRRFHPSKRLPEAFRQDTLEVVVEGKLREDLYGRNMYGTALEVLAIYPADSYISPEDQQAIALTLKRMEAFNTKDLNKLQQIDVLAQNLTTEKFQSWFGSGNYQFTLHYLETDIPSGQFNEGAPITGFCLYSRDIVNGMALSGNSQYSLMKFTIAKVDGTWKFTATGNYIPENDIDPNQFVDELLKKSQKKYGTSNLAEWTSSRSELKHN
ncbi:MAG: hypothetical protein H6Q74_311 [Firmicutes bacterium]|nr:hypothetical protein [Bacillota bacterium]